MPAWLTCGDRALRAGALAALLLDACDSGPLTSAGSKAETFDWAGEPIAFAPPPSGWRREDESSGGLKGMRFVKEGSVGEAIGVADFFTLARRRSTRRCRSRPRRSIAATATRRARSSNARWPRPSG